MAPTTTDRWPRPSHKENKMPFFGRQGILTKTTAAAAVGAYAFNDDKPGASSAINGADKASYVTTLGATKLSDAGAFSIVTWLRVNGFTNNVDTAATFGGNDYTIVLQSYKGTSPNDNNGFNLILGPDSTGGNFYNNVINIGVNSLKSGGPYDTAQKYKDNFLNGEWHCVMWSCALNSVANSRLYIDGVDVGAGRGTDTSATTSNQNVWPIFPFRFNRQPTITAGYTADQECGAQVDIGPTWFYDSIVDFSNATTRGYYYNAANTDGYVDGGTAGTTGGAAAAKLYWYQPSSGNLVMGGSLANTTVTKVTKGSGNINIISNTEGPGSGDTY
jgi:hypothetical protein